MSFPSQIASIASGRADATDRSPLDMSRERVPGAKTSIARPESRCSDGCPTCNRLGARRDDYLRREARWRRERGSLRPRAMNADEGGRGRATRVCADRSAHERMRARPFARSTKVNFTSRPLTCPEICERTESVTDCRHARSLPVRESEPGKRGTTETTTSRYRYWC